MNRRDLLVGLSATALARPASALAAQSSAVVAWLSSLHPSHSVTLPFMLRGLAETGYVEGRNLTIKDASAEGHPERFPERAAEVVSERVSLIAAVSGLPSVEAARAQTSTIPIVFIVLGDPVELGLVASINRPGANLTGIGGGGTLMLAKQMEVLSEVVPGSAPIAVLVDPNTEAAGLEKSARAASQALHRRIFIATAASERDFEASFASIVRERAAGVVITSQPLLTSHHRQLAELAGRFRIPAIYDPQDLASSGGLMSYGASVYDIFRQVGVIAGKILAGAKPADFPVEEPDRIKLKINLKTAKALGIEIPNTLLARAEEVIE